MKKIVTVLLAVVMVFGVVGCGKGEPQSVTLTKTQNGATVEMKCDAEGDTITKITQNSTISLDSYSDDQVSQIETAAKASKTKYETVDGCSYESKTENKKFTETIVMNITSDSLKKLIDAGLLPITDKNADYLSLDKTKEGLTGQGWKAK